MLAYLAAAKPQKTALIAKPLYHYMRDQPGSLMYRMGTEKMEEGIRNQEAMYRLMGMEEDAIAMAYERTCLNTGGLNWAYMNKILQRWQEQGFRTVQDVQSGDHKSVPKGASGQLGEAELGFIQRALQEG